MTTTVNHGSGDKIPDGLTQTLVYYVTQENSDLTEGRGSMRDISYWTNENDAYIAAKGRGVQGVGDGEVIKVTICHVMDTVSEMRILRERVYGYGKAWDGKWRSTWMDHRDAPQNDPEYAEYQRLKSKFETS